MSNYRSTHLAANELSVGSHSLGNAFERPVRVLIADDHRVLAESLSLYLDGLEEYETVGIATTGEQIIQLITETQADVLLLDLYLPGLSGIQVLEWMRTRDLDLPVIVLTAHYQPAHFSRAIRLGAMGFLRKEMALRMLPAAISTVLRGETIVDNSLLRETMKASAPTRPVRRVAFSGPREDLTDQETLVLRMLARGMNNAEIGNTLAITESTVKTHLSSIYGKLGKSDRTQAAIWAVQHGLGP